MSAAGIPTFVADVKATCRASPWPAPPPKTHEIFAARAQDIGYAGWQYRDCPVQLWDLFGEQGHRSAPP